MLKDKLIAEMKAVFDGVPFWTEHTLKVLRNAEEIAGGEGMTDDQKALIFAAAVLHDIGAMEAQRKHGSTAREYQEQEGPAVARALLDRCGYGPEVIDRVCFIVGHHHSPSAIDGLDFQVQWEADLLENLRRRRPQMTEQEIKDAVAANFRTTTGLRMAQEILIEGR